MAIWKEIRCDALPMGRDCLSARNEGPKGFEPALELIKQAEADGWRFDMNLRAMCPGCLENHHG